MQLKSGILRLTSLVIAGGFIPSNASPVGSRSNASSPLIPHLLHQFPNGTWVENLLTLQTGQILVTLMNSAEVVLFDPNNSTLSPPIAYHDPSHTAVLGLAQPDPHTVAVVVGNLSFPAQVDTPGSFGVRLLRLSGQDSNLALTPLAWFPIPGAAMLDGMTAIPGSSHYLLIADTDLGVIWRLDLRTGSSVQAFTDSALLGKVPGTSTGAVNGVHAQDGFVYFTNSNRALFGRIPMSAEGLPTGDAGEVIVRDFAGATYDDFALGDGTRFFLCSPTGYSMNLAFLNGTETVLAGGLSDVSFDHPIAAMFGKTECDRNTLYVTTAGIIPGVGGSGGGQLFAVDGVTP